MGLFDVFDRWATAGVATVLTGMHFVLGLGDPFFAFITSNPDLLSFVSLVGNYVLPKVEVAWLPPNAGQLAIYAVSILSLVLMLRRWLLSATDRLLRHLRQENDNS